MRFDKVLTAFRPEDRANPSKFVIPPTSGMTDLITPGTAPPA
jgi:hypothetical protein